MPLKFFQIDLVPPRGGVIDDASVTVKIHGTSTRANIYSDSSGGSPINNPFIISGFTITFYVDDTDDYDLFISGGNLQGTYTVQNIWSLPGPIWADMDDYWADVGHIWAYIYPYAVLTATVQNVGQLYTANDLIRAAMRLTQVASIDADLTAQELTDGLQSLNRMLDSWSADELMLYQVTRESFWLTSGQNPYTIGYGGDFDTSRPLKIVDAQLVLYNASLPVTYPMAVVQYDAYNSIRLKTLATNIPNCLYYQPSFPLGEIYIYPIFAPSGTSTQAGIVLSSWKAIDVISDPTASMAFPPGYWEMLVYNLALRIADEYQLQVNDHVKQNALMTMKRVKRMNQRTPTLQYDAALMNTSQRRYNIYSDGF